MAKERIDAVVASVGRIIMGKEEAIRLAVVCLLARGHLLFEDLPGVGKTTLSQALARALGMVFRRVQFTSDLLPADILGTHIVNENEHGRRVLFFEKGPVFKNLLLVDEINRATPKTQAALLEVMQEHAVTTGGERHSLPMPFFVMATQNPMEMEGTYPLPEAQVDRFMFKLRVPFPDIDSLVEISKRTTGFKEPQLNAIIGGKQLISLQQQLGEISVPDPVAHYAAQLVLASHPEQPGVIPEVARYVSYGASPRGLQSLIRGARVWAAVQGRLNVSADDVTRVAKVALRHRIILNFEGEAGQIRVDDIIDKLLASVKTPAQLAA